VSSQRSDADERLKPMYRCKHRKPDGTIVDGCGWQGAEHLKCPSCGSDVLRSRSVTYAGADPFPTTYDAKAFERPAGLKFDHGKPPWHLLAWDAIKLVVLVLAFGAKKYADRNWERGIAHSRTFAAAQRHMHAWYQEREDNDPETGLHHLAHAICELMFALAFDVRKMHRVTVELPLENGTKIEVELDNRPGELVA
jgi:hypothetical protein